jgi:hypothetical protein
MNESKITRAMVVFLAAILFLGTLQGNMQHHGIALDDRMLSQIEGALDFWRDPCTWDGFATGAGIILCLSWNVGGCVTAATGITKALKYDNCF